MKKYQYFTFIFLPIYINYGSIHEREYKAVDYEHALKHALKDASWRDENNKRVYYVAGNNKDRLNALKDAINGEMYNKDMLLRLFEVLKQLGYTYTIYADAVSFYNQFSFITIKDNKRSYDYKIMFNAIGGR